MKMSKITLKCARLLYYFIAYHIAFLREGKWELVVDFSAWFCRTPA